MQHCLVISSLAELPIAAKQLLEICKEKKIIAFYGSMGAGKTTFIKAICKELGVKDAITSPTFSLVNEYNYLSSEKIFHFDFYRIKSLNEAFDMGYEEYFYSSHFCFIEWPEKVEELLPEETVVVKIENRNEVRHITVELQ